MAGGCVPSPDRPLRDRDPAFVIPAVKNVADENRPERTEVNRLVELLESEDAAVRLSAVQALRELSGQRFGYDFWADPAARAPALRRWQMWAASEQARTRRAI